MTEPDSTQTPRSTAEAVLTLAADWDARIAREFKVNGYTDWHSEEIRTLLASLADTQPTCDHGIALADLCAAAESHAEERYGDGPKTCSCGGEIGPRVPGDADGLGCLDDINHAWNEPPVSDMEIEVRERVADAASELRWQIHAIRFAKEEGTLEGPDNFYNGVITAEAIARRYNPSPATDRPRWMDGWLAAMDWLAEYKGADGIALAEEMATRLPEDVLASRNATPRTET